VTSDTSFLISLVFNGYLSYSHKTVTEGG